MALSFIMSITLPRAAARRKDFTRAPPRQATADRRADGPPRGGKPKSSLRWRSAFSHELVDAAVLGQSGVDIAMRVHADAVDVPGFHAGQHVSLSVPDANMGGPTVLFLLGDVEIAVLAAGDVVGAAHAGPLPEEFALGREDLDALIGAVGDVELAVIIERDAVRQVELALALARRAP